jgi:hypothetical protein
MGNLPVLSLGLMYQSRILAQQFPAPKNPKSKIFQILLARNVGKEIEMGRKTF